MPTHFHNSPGCKFYVNASVTEQPCSSGTAGEALAVMCNDSVYLHYIEKYFGFLRYDKVRVVLKVYVFDRDGGDVGCDDVGCNGGDDVGGNRTNSISSTNHTNHTNSASHTNRTRADNDSNTLPYLINALSLVILQLGLPLNYFLVGVRVNNCNFILKNDGRLVGAVCSGGISSVGFLDDVERRCRACVEGVRSELERVYGRRVTS